MATGIITMKSSYGGLTKSILVLADTSAAVGSSLKSELYEVPTSESPNFQNLPEPYLITDIITKDGVTGIIQLYVDGSPQAYFVDLAAQGASNPGRTPMSIPLMPNDSKKTLKVEWRVKSVIGGY